MTTTPDPWRDYVRALFTPDEDTDVLGTWTAHTTDTTTTDDTPRRRH